MSTAEDLDGSTETASPAEETFDLSLSGSGIKLERKVGQAAALQILAIAMGSGGESASAPLALGALTQPQPTHARGGARVSVREYLAEVGAKRNPDKILAIGKYLVEFRGQESFTSNDVKGQFRLAGEALPANYPRDFRWTVTNGWISEDHQAPGQYYVTGTGDEALESKFAKEIKKKTSLSSGTRRRRKKKTTGETE